ncbi:homoserine kinase [Paenibacillus prosopidis]|uniref:Ser/Thr protein kinase RdoA (MazF antagonist) n=1 Tax=Paenibacillus prosopidis TaxID=630520 RepID=A0A368W5F0_9BACL|nr:homoserine kinase [Paenibacillus prosopidis]RCW50268.1 Ser/Thr protein kinase RdoA (MazF antagonist) [Paenibacillus prosopidis]
MVYIPAIHTVFDKENLFKTMAILYHIGTPIKSRFIANGLNDTYMVETENGPFVLRIYKHQWRSEADIRFELDLLLHLNRFGIPVSYPIPNKDGQLLTEIEAPEGMRYAVLFTFADGSAKVDVDTSRLYGHSTAQLHKAMDSYVPKYKRFELSSTHLFDEPLEKILPFLHHRPDDLKFLTETASRLKNRLNALTEGALDWGVCHGDLHGWNVFHSDSGNVTHFDFDCCGIGWRSYDLSVFLWDRVHGRSKKEDFKDECWDAFLDAYTKERPLKANDLEMIPLFVAARQLWLMGLHTGNSAIWGAWQDDGYFDGKLKFLIAWIDAHSL